METARALDCLRSVPLFQNLPDDKLAWITEHSDEVRLGAGATIARQGDPPDGFYVVMEGETEWTRRVGQEDVFVVTLGKAPSSRAHYGPRRSVSNDRTRRDGRGFAQARLAVFLGDAQDLSRGTSRHPGHLRRAHRTARIRLPAAREVDLTRHDGRRARPRTEQPRRRHRPQRRRGPRGLPGSLEEGRGMAVCP